MIFDNRNYLTYSMILITTFWIIGDLSTTYIALSLGASESGIVATNLVRNYSIIYNITYKTTITLLYVLTAYIMDKYISYNKDNLSENRYRFYKSIPNLLIILIILNGIYLTINNTYVIYYMM